MMRYKCIESFMISIYDGDGFTTEDEMMIKEGSTWIDEGREYRVCGGEYRLDSESDDYTWIEIDEECLEKYFEELSE